MFDLQPPCSRHSNHSSGAAVWLFAALLFGTLSSGAAVWFFAALLFGTLAIGAAVWSFAALPLGTLAIGAAVSSFAYYTPSPKYSLHRVFFRRCIIFILSLILLHFRCSSSSPCFSFFSFASLHLSQRKGVISVAADADGQMQIESRRRTGSTHSCKTACVARHVMAAPAVGAGACAFFARMNAGQRRGTGQQRPGGQRLLGGGCAMTCSRR